MRETCLFCVSKHIAQAVVLVNESVTGYPLHIWVAIGHLAEAETESVSRYPEFANAIRTVRLALMGQEGNFVHTSLMSLLQQARDIAEELNGEKEDLRIKRILFGSLKTPEKTPLQKLEELQTFGFQTSNTLVEVETFGHKTQEELEADW